MAYAKFDVELRLDERWERIADKHRAACKGVYMDAILYSAEMLADGRVSRAVLLTLCENSGLKRGGFVLTNLLESGFLQKTKPGVFVLTDWHLFHSSRAEVERQRLAAAERKRRSRGQMSLDTSHLLSQRDDTVTSHRDEGVTRAHARAGEQPQPQRQPQPAAGTKDLEESEPDQPAAAEPSQTEAPRPSRIEEVVHEFAPGDSDSINHIEPLAAQLPSDVFEAIVEKTKSRKQLRNKAGFLVDSMRNELRKRQRTNATMNGDLVITSPIEKIKREHPERYVEAMNGALDEPALEAYLNTYVPDEDQRIALRDLWHDARTAAA